MDDELLRSGIKRLRGRFRAAADQGLRLDCCLCETPVLGPRAINEPPSFRGRRPVLSPQYVRRLPETLDKADCGAQWTLRFYGAADADGRPSARSVKARSELLLLARSAGELVQGVPTDSLPVALDPLLAKADEPLPGLCLWAVFLFELAWAKIPCSPLTASPKTVWEGGTTFDLDEVPGLSPVYRGVIPDPPCWYSFLEDVLGASADALNVFLHNLPQPVAAEHAEAADVTQQGAHATEGADVMLTHPDLAKRYHLEPEALRKRLDRWRRTHDDDWSEVADRKPHEPKYLYRLSAVLPIVCQMQDKASGESSG